MDKSLQREKAERFRSLHKGRILILPNAWDVPSARIFEESGFPAVATSSAGLMVSLGYPDGEAIPREEYLSCVRRMSGALSIPLSVDIVSGFGETEAEVETTTRDIIEAGGIGINIEDLDHRTGHLFSVEKGVEKIRWIKKAAESCGVPIVINGRTDALRHSTANREEEKLNEAISRAQAYRDAGADCVYPMGLTDASSIERFVTELDYPTNVMIRRGLPIIPELERLGIARVSFGPSASYATFGLLRRASREILEEGSFNLLIDGAITFDELNNLASKRESRS